MRGDIGRREAQPRVGGADPRFGRFDRLGGGGLLGVKPISLASRLRRGLLEPRGLRVGGGLLGQRRA